MENPTYFEKLYLFDLICVDNIIIIFFFLILKYNPKIFFSIDLFR